MAVREVCIKIEVTVPTNLNVAKVRDRIKLLESTAWSNGPPAVLSAIQALVDGTEMPKIVSHAASYNTRFGRKDGEAK